jgi:CheY-like chemotaxis protein
LTYRLYLDEPVEVAIILVIDDDPDIRKLLKDTLEGGGHQVSLASNGQEGVRQFKAKRADLVITDLFMPEQEGLETIKQLRLEFPDIPIIAISGRPTGGTMLSVAQRLGATAVLLKPFLPEELLRTVEQTL